MLRFFFIFIPTVSSPVKCPLVKRYSTDDSAAIGAWVLLQAGQQEGVRRSDGR